MTRTEKTQIIDELTQKLASNNHFYITDGSGLTVAQVNLFREKCYQAEVEYKVAKNTFIKRALQNNDYDVNEIDQALKGMSGIMFVKENANVPAKIIKEFKKQTKQEKPTLKAASIEKEVYLGDNQLDKLVNLKSKQELIGEIVGLLQSPIKTLIAQLETGKNTLAGIVKTLKDKEL